MAFPLPDHLPRKAAPQDVSSQILGKISEATSKSLTASLAASWLSELEGTIRQTKDRIHDRIHSELPAFERQLATSKSVQTRLHGLSTNVDALSASLSHPETGILHPLLRSLSAHSALAQQSSDADVAHEALSYLSRYNMEYENLSALVHDGRLAEAVNSGESLQKIVDKAPEALARAEIMADLKRQLRALRDRTEEQLSDAYSRSIRISSTELSISPSVQVRQSQTIISLLDILRSLSDVSLNAHLSSLRRDLTAHFIDFPLQQPVSATIMATSDPGGAPSQTLALFPLPAQLNLRKSTLDYLKTLFDFLNSHLFPFLPPSARAPFPQSLCRPTTTALLRDALVPALPSSIVGLPRFLALVHDAVGFEQEYIGSLFGDDTRGERNIKAWADGVAGHFGRKRRVDLLESARACVLRRAAPGTEEQVFRVEVAEDPEPEAAPIVVPVQGDIGGEDENEWDFEDADTKLSADVRKSGEPVASTVAPAIGKSVSKASGKSAEENGWDFDDDVPFVDEDKEPQPNASMEEQPEENPEDAWGWGDDVEAESMLVPSGEVDDPPPSTNKTNGNGTIGATPMAKADSADAWGDAWDEPLVETVQSPPTPPSPVHPLSPAKQPKLAKRLEKFTAKGKGLASPSFSSSNPASPFLASSTTPPSSTTSFHSTQPGSTFSSQSPRSFSPLQQHTTVSKPETLVLPTKPKEKESYVVSNRAKDIVHIVEDILAEGDDVARSDIFARFSYNAPTSASSPSVLILQTASFVLDLYRALYPVAFSAKLNRADCVMRFSNDCLHVAEEVGKMKLPHVTSNTVEELMHESIDRLKGLGDWWFDEGVEQQEQSVLKVLERAEGFVDTGDQERFDECEGVMSDVLRTVRSVGYTWKTTLPRTKYYRAIGRVVETALTRILEDVLALPDIPEVDSRRLSELCRILNALEGLFVDDPDAPSMVVAYVPSWLKYSYLSELLEASIADISYLFDEGALIDFEVDELVNLVRALFADTPLRTNTIAKLQKGHPVPIS